MFVGFNWKHWALIIGAPALSAVVSAYNKNGGALNREALTQDFVALVFAVMAVLTRNPTDSASVKQAGALLPMLLFVFWTGLCATGCAAIPAVVAQISQIASIIVQDVEKGMPASAIIQDVIAQTGVQDASVIAQVIQALLADPKVPPADLPGLHDALGEAQRRVAQQSVTTVRGPLPIDVDVQ